MKITAKQSSRRGGYTLLIVLFVVYLVLLAWLVLWRYEVPWVGAGALRQVKLVPFASSAGAGASAPREVVANFVFFVPAGIYLALLAANWTWWKTTAVLAGGSLLLEVVQYALAVGASDVTDIVANTAGGLAGLGLVTLLRRRLRDRTLTVMTRACLIGTVLAVMAVAMFIASPLRFAPPRDSAIAATRVDF